MTYRHHSLNFIYFQVNVILHTKHTVSSGIQDDLFHTVTFNTMREHLSIFRVALTIQKIFEQPRVKCDRNNVLSFYGILSTSEYVHPWMIPDNNSIL